MAVTIVLAVLYCTLSKLNPLFSSGPKFLTYLSLWINLQGGKQQVTVGPMDSAFNSVSALSPFTYGRPGRCEPQAVAMLRHPTSSPNARRKKNRVFPSGS
ncbi:hypothetical protein O6H91_11G103900 [Diphasiastrum complanatum]|uniref:Uncharacterized protein n=1 Tax=Diphasiastrum complanatum TaxID=34168 RepID=A0ACC2CC54_DIPCM|nr:hypothetical protein O6H91_11G103900 [Diphasiastrum complanatum]